MNTSNVRGMIAVFALAIGGMGLAKAQSSPAPGQQQKIAVEEKVEATQNPAVEAKGNPKQEGIKVHGHWIIEVKDPDGTVKTHREFENSLFSGSNGGAYFLANAVLGYSVTGGFGVELVYTGGVGLIINSPGMPCFAPPSSVQCSNTLTASTISNGHVSRYGSFLRRFELKEHGTL
jgi:hypothetical protein